MVIDNKMKSEVLPVFERLHNEHQLDVFEFGTIDGVVFFRGHNPGKFGDDKREYQPFKPHSMKKNYQDLNLEAVD